MTQIRISGDNGELFTAEVVKLPGCCGVAVVHGWGMRVTAEQAPAFHKKIQHYLEASSAGQLNRCKVLIADRVYDEDYEHFHRTSYGFCKAMGWEEGSINNNGLSGNKIQLFELNRKVIR